MLKYLQVYLTLLRGLYMNFRFCASVVGILGILGLLIKRSKSADDTESREKFWDKEAAANFVRKKSLDDLNYINIPEEILSLKLTSSTDAIDKLLNTIKALSTKKIVNLTGISNTDLKLKYGTANITILAEYDGNYTDLVVTLQKLAEELVEINEINSAISVLEFAISTNTDVSRTYYLLSELYKKAGTPEKSEYLLVRAENLKTLMKDTIVRNLKASGL